MSRRLVAPIPAAVSDAQNRASDPRGSAWVHANAGSGKTHVLTARVLRLLLAGTRPEEILCLTYTKAAAAEMRRRVSARLATWALLDDAALRQELATVTDGAPNATLLARARTLFAHALETPGGLKINTIHAFCESVLHRFPLESGVPFDFTVIEEAEAEELVRTARETTLAGGLRGDAATAEAVETLFDLVSDHSLGEAIDAALGTGRRLRRVLADRAGARARLRRLVGARDGETRTAVLAEIADGHRLEPAHRAAIFAVRPPAPDGSAFEDRLARLDPEAPDPLELLAAFLTADQTVPKRFPSQALKTADPALAALLQAEAERLEALALRLNRATLLARSDALLDVLAAISDRYEADKRARSLLDFDDLIAHIAELFEDTARSAWVRYKLDAGISHILVDESQDTNAEQWRVVRALVAEFFAGEGAVTRPRSLFAVGDEKQSIYSFQGADPHLFGAAGQHYAAAARAVVHPFAPVTLETSFRSLPGVLGAVDRVFAAPELRHAVLSPDAPVKHRTARAEGGGSVTLWPVWREAEPMLDLEDWPRAPLETVKSAPRQLAEHIAGQIADWLEQGRLLPARGRPVRPDDILVLVQSRQPMLPELIRALTARHIPTPGADRLAVTGHVGVLDLLALGDVLLNPADDLQLAALLRSPLFDIDESALAGLAIGRPGSLWQALAASDMAEAQAAATCLADWRARLDFERPFEFYSEVLYSGGGLRRFHARLGAEIDDVMTEFLELALAHEQRPQPSLQGFLAETRARNVTIKRELGEAAGGVRVMTVHGAKGLEAPIVILADATRRAGAGGRSQPVFVVDEAPGPLLVHASAAKDHLEETRGFADTVKAARVAEYWRALYVGMTRAEDELYVTGALTRKGKLEESWYAAIETALADDAVTRLDASGGILARVYEAPPAAPAAPAATGAAALPQSPARETLGPLPVPALVPVIQPSRAGETDPQRVYDDARATLLDADTARRRGIALHALLQHLARLPPADRPTAVARALPVLLPDDPAGYAALGHKAMSILARPELADLFGPHSRAEVPFMLDVMRRGSPARLAGRIDRMLVAQHRVLVVDYKSDANPPGDASEVPASYVLQVGLYAHVASQLFPGLAVEVGILWTTLESLMILPPDQLREAVSAFTMR